MRIQLLILILFGFTFNAMAANCAQIISGKCRSGNCTSGTIINFSQCSATDKTNISLTPNSISLIKFSYNERSRSQNSQLNCKDGWTANINSNYYTCHGPSKKS